LDTARVETEHNAHGLDQLGLGEARQADQQRVSAAEHSDERLLDHPFLPEDHVADCSLGGGDLGACRLRLTHDHVFELFQPFGGYRHDISSLLSGCYPGVSGSGSPIQADRVDQKTCNIRAKYHM